MQLIKGRLPAVQQVIVVVAALCVGSFYLMKGVEDHRQATMAQQAHLVDEGAHIAEIEAIKE